MSPVIPLPVGTSASASTDKLAELTRSMPTETRDALSWLAHLLDASIPLRTSEDTDDFAHRHLYRGGKGLIALHESLGLLTAPAMAHAIADDMRAHEPIEIAGLESDESPQWDVLDLGGERRSVPRNLNAAFAAGTLAQQIW